MALVSLGKPDSRTTRTASATASAMFTLLEGEWDEVFDTIKKATEAVRAVSPRTSLVVKADIREGVTNQLTDKVDAVNRRLAKED